MSQPPGRDELSRRYERRMQLLVPAEAELLARQPLFAGIPEKARPKVIEKVRRYIHLVQFEEGDTVLREGDYSDSAYFVVAGGVEVVLTGESAARPQVRGGAHVPGAQNPNARPDLVNLIGRGGAGLSGTVMLSAAPADVVRGNQTMGPGEIFGEIGALSRYPVSATVRALTRVTLLQIRLPGLRMLLVSSKDFKKSVDERYRTRILSRQLRKVPLFSKLDDAFLEDVQKRAELVAYDPGQVIVQEGASAEDFLLVIGGYVKVSVRSGAADLALTYLRKGDFAGESALLLEESWPFTLQALEHVELAKLSRDMFRAITGAYPVLEDELWGEAVQRLKARGALKRKPTSSEYVQMAMETGLIHGESVLLIDLSTCTRCDECVRGCADAHGGEPRFIREGEKYRRWLIPTACYQCTDPVCMIDCPTGAITRQVGTLEVTIDEPTCIGCSNCANRCPWGNITMVEKEEKRPDGKPVEVATKCDLCLTRPEGPACVQMCPHGSAVRISFKDLDRVTSTLT
ncbi:MAG TPA: cyclic nucleotide-binding domain-containing protein [Vicinamibacteria bacterium]|nr:cyclic nucleotide-binding domain-containing protein [Vicinamibacteria bacterium]